MKYVLLIIFYLMVIFIDTFKAILYFLWSFSIDWDDYYQDTKHLIEIGLNED